MPFLNSFKSYTDCSHQAGPQDPWIGPLVFRKAKEKIARFTDHI